MHIPSSVNDRLFYACENIHNIVVLVFESFTELFKDSVVYLKPRKVSHAGIDNHKLWNHGDATEGTTYLWRSKKEDERVWSFGKDVKFQLQVWNVQKI